MKNIITFIFALMSCAGVMADDITPKQAMEQAQNFLQKRSAKGSWNKTTETTSLIEAGQVEGLYIFNVEGNGGFVVVANDDAVTPILGYSERGNLDVANMPENMRAWLKGYADEIAWVKSARTIDGEKSNSLDVDMGESKPTAVKTAIAPLLTTRWNQRDPYNALCPNNYVTGCVATAMAQVMYYTETHAGNSTTQTTTTIPAYGLSTQDIPAGTPIYWESMIDSYAGSDTGEQAQAVAELMLYVGTSVQMEYGPSSSANSANAAPALKTYFDYSTTVQHLSRSFYSYGNWIDILYHELSEQRPVFYGGMSTGGGHAFVIDGYDSEDYFHINWGWGGMSDDYFKLSALNPDEQGTGGYTGTNGYRFAQEAVIGIQKSGGEGSVSPLVESAKVNISLFCNGISVDKSTAKIKETVKVTVNVTNNSSQPYDGDIILGYGENLLNAGKTFKLQPGETKDCEIDLIPNFVGTIPLSPFYPSENGNYFKMPGDKSVQLTVNNADITDNVNLALDYTVTFAEPTGSQVETKSGLVDVYNLTGNDFEANITLKNETETDYTGTLIWVFHANGGSGAVNQISASIPAGEEKLFTVTVPDLDYSKQYFFYTTYVKGDTYNLVPNGFYKLQPALMTYAADGTKTITKTSATSYTAPADVLVVDVTGTSITQITPNANKNTLYISNGALSGLDGKNVVTNNLDGTYSATSIALEDDSPFYSPVDISVAKAEFTYQFTKAADGTNGWNTLMLPFDVTSVTADDSEIDWFHSSTDTGKNFWLKAFTNDTSDEVLFSFVSGSIEANTPYIVAFPGSKWGEKWDMSKKKIKFIGENTQLKKTSRSVVTGSYYRFVGSTLQDNTENIYSLNSEGNAFDLKATGGSSPFRAYFKADGYDALLASLGIGSDSATGIGIVNDIVHDNKPAKVKVIKNGKLYIGNYNIVGQQIK